MNKRKLLIEIFIFISGLFCAFSKLIWNETIFFGLSIPLVCLGIFIIIYSFDWKAHRSNQKNKNLIEISVDCNREELRNYLSERKHEHIKISVDGENDVVLEMLWQSHGNKYTEYEFIGNLSAGKIVGKFEKPKGKEVNKDDVKIPLKDSIAGFLILIVAIGLIIGLPFLIVLAFSDSWEWGLIAGKACFMAIIALILTCSKHDKIHEKNLVEFFSELRHNKYTN